MRIHDSMTDYKPWYTSKTIWGALAVLLTTVLNIFDVPIAEEHIQELVLIIASAVTLFGRITAKKQVR